MTTTTAPTTTTTTAAPTTTTAAPTTTTTGPAPDDGVLERGEQGEAVAALQRRLAELHFDPGPADGAFGTGGAPASRAARTGFSTGRSGTVSRALRKIECARAWAYWT